MKCINIFCFSIVTVVLTAMFSCSPSTTSKDNAMILSYYNKSKYVKGSDTLSYRILYPRDFDLNKVYPLVLFLHGSGERGNDNQSQLKHIASLFQSDEVRDNHPAIIVFPQCPTDGYWANVERSNDVWSVESTGDPTPSLQLVMELMDKMKTHSFVDRQRIYVGGLSMGGFGTFDLLVRDPDTYAAGIAICGGADLRKLDLIKEIPLRIYHGAQDPVVSVSLSREASQRLQDLGGTSVKYTEYSDGAHDIWTRAMTEPDQFDWLFSQHK